MTCTYNGRSYAEGSLTCQNGREMKCRGGEWQETGYPCSTANPDSSLANSADEAQDPSTCSAMTTAYTAWNSTKRDEASRSRPA